MTASLTALIERLEREAAGSDLLSIEVAKLCAPDARRPPAHAHHSGSDPESGSPEWETERWRRHVDGIGPGDDMDAYDREMDAIAREENGGSGWFERYTTSIDAALELVPEGWAISHAYWRRERSGFVLTRGAGREAQFAEGRSSAPNEPAIALCIAALQARCGRP